MTFTDTEEVPFDPNRRERSKPNGKVHADQQLLNVQRAVDFKLDPNPRHLLKGLIHPGDASVWYGPSGSGKTFESINIAHAISTGRELLGRRVRKAPVVYFGLEGAGGLSKRVVALQREYGDAPDLFIYRHPLTLFRNPEAVQAAIATIKDCRAELAWFDTLSRTMTGADENSASDMTHMVGVSSQIQHATGAHVAWTHHTGKDEGRGARGHNSLRGAVDVEVEISKSESGVRTLRIAKGRDDQDGQTYAFQLKVVELGVDDDGDAMTTCIVEHLENAPAGGGAALKGDERGWFDDIRSLFEEEAQVTTLRPHPEMPLQRCTTREALRAWLQNKGRIGVAPDVALTNTERSLLSRYLNRLKDKGKLCMAGKFLWLTE